MELLLPPGTESHSYEPTPADILKVQSCDLFLYLGGDSDQWVETILEAAEPTGRTLALIDCVETLEEEHVEGMQEEVGHHHDEDEDDHDHDHLGTVTEIDEHVWTAPANAAAITRQFGEVLAELDSAKGERYPGGDASSLDPWESLTGPWCLEIGSHCGTLRKNLICGTTRHFRDAPPRRNRPPRPLLF